MDGIVQDFARALFSAVDVETARLLAKQTRMRFVQSGMKADELSKNESLLQAIVQAFEEKLKIGSKLKEVQVQKTEMKAMLDEVRLRKSAAEVHLVQCRSLRDQKKGRLESVVKDNQRLRDQIRVLKERRVVLQERLRLTRKSTDLRQSETARRRDQVIAQSADFDRQMAAAPWRAEEEEKQKKRMEIEQEIKKLECEVAVAKRREERNKIARESEAEYPCKEFIIKFAELRCKHELLARKCRKESRELDAVREERMRSQSQINDTFASQMDCTQALLNLDDDDGSEEYSQLAPPSSGEEACHPKFNAPSNYMERQSNHVNKSPEESDESGNGTASVEASQADNSSINGGSQNAPLLTLDGDQGNTCEEVEEEIRDDGHDVEDEEIEPEREDEEEEREEEREEEEVEHPNDDAEVVIDSQADDDIGDATNDNEQGMTNAAFDPEVVLNMSATSNDPGGDFFNLMEGESRKRMETGRNETGGNFFNLMSGGGSPKNIADTTGNGNADSGGNFFNMMGGESPKNIGDTTGNASGGADFFNMFGGGAPSGDANTSTNDAFSFNFGASDASQTGGGDTSNGNGFNFFGF